MERLTSYKSVCKREMICRHEDCNTDKEYCLHMNEDNYPCLQGVLEKLGSYEDIGLLPEQLIEIDKLYTEKCIESAKLQKELKRYKNLERQCIADNAVGIEAMLKKFEEFKDDIQELYEYRKLEGQGKLLKLHCIVGDTVWYISDRIEKQGRKKVTVSFAEKGTVDNITLGHMMVPQITVCNDEDTWTTFDSVEDFGKTVFLTREEAEAALKEL